MGSGPIVLAYIVLGRLIVWTAQTSGPTKKLWALSPFLEELGACDFCLGCWIFPVLAWLFGVNVTGFYFPFVTEVITGIATSFAVHLVRLGWQAKFGIEILS